MKTIVIAGAAMMALASCSVRSTGTMTEEEVRLINDSPEVMRILTVESEEDVAVLRRSSADFNMADISSPEYEALARKLVTTLESTDGGVGLAAPQVGISRRVVAVQRVDKEGEPIEVYANIAIVDKRGEMVAGPEGCLSVPDQRGEVLRSQDITIRYTDITGGPESEPREIREDVSGFAAVIFQHEVDHLDGVLYIDKKL